jgi:uncharacterized membrane protein YfcA
MQFMIEIPEGLDNAQLWAIVVGFISPIALNFIINANWKDWVKSLVAFGFSAIVGTITAWLVGAYTGLDLVSTILLTLVVAIASYQLFWRKVAPNMQRGSATKAALDAEKERAKIADVAAPVAAKVASQVAHEIPISEIPQPADPEHPNAVG